MKTSTSFSEDQGQSTSRLMAHTRTTITVGGAPKLYTLFHAAQVTTGNLEFIASPGIQAYDFTFG